MHEWNFSLQVARLGVGWVNECISPMGLIFHLFEPYLHSSHKYVGITILTTTAAIYKPLTYDKKSMGQDDPPPANLPAISTSWFLRFRPGRENSGAIAET